MNWTAGDRLRTAIELFEVAEKIMLQNLRRRLPDANEEEIQQRFRDWLGKKHDSGTAPWKVRRKHDQ